MWKRTDAFNRHQQFLFLNTYPGDEHPKKNTAWARGFDVYNLIFQKQKNRRRKTLFNKRVEIRSQRLFAEGCVVVPGYCTEKTRHSSRTKTIA
jgi:hypothetical protein